MKNKKIFKSKYAVMALLVVLLVALKGVSLYAQQVAEATTAQGGDSSMLWILDNMVLILGSVAVFAALFSLFSVLDRLAQVEKLRLLEEKGLLTKETVTKVATEPLWKRINDWAWKIVPVENEKDIMLAHPHDGIYELDNRLPPWWLALFYGCIVFAVAYMTYYHFTDYGMNQEEEYEYAMKKADEQVQEYLAGQANLVDETNVIALADEGRIASGETIFKDNCAVCHGGVGEGGIGPNLTDAYWLHGGDIKDVFKTIKYGAPNGMKSWKSDLTAGQMSEVASFILTLQGTTPAGAKEPQGELYQPTNTDSTATGGAGMGSNLELESNSDAKGSGF